MTSGQQFLEINRCCVGRSTQRRGQTVLVIPSRRADYRIQTLIAVKIPETDTCRSKKEGEIPKRMRHASNA